MGRLCLTRKIGERIRIGADIWVEVADVKRKQVWLVLHAPKEVPILREELIGREEEPCRKPA